MRQKQMEHLTGIDIGGSHIRIAEFESGKIEKFRELRTPRTLAAFRQIVRTACAGREAVGVSAAGVVSGTKIAWSPNIPYLRNFDFRKYAAGKLAVMNDARAFARAELWARRGAKDMLAVTLGTGVGRAYAKNGAVRKIKNLEKPERWEKEYQKGLYANGLAAYLARKLRPLIRKHNPKLIVFGGGVLKHAGFLARLRRELHKQGIRVKIEKAKLPEYAAAWGACLPLLEK